MSAAVKVEVSPAWSAVPPSVDTSSGCRCLIDSEDPFFPMIRFFDAFPEALLFATEHAETHTCPSRRASGERCTTFCADCGGRGWVA